MKPVKISNRNIMFTQKMNEQYDLNLGLILGKKHNFVIDTGLGSGSVAPIIESIGNDKKPLIVVNTHCHWDHIWGNWMFADHTIISHQKCRELEDQYWEMALDEFKESIDGEVHKCLPNLVFQEEIVFPEDGVRLFFTPGHSADCISIYDEVEKVLYAGDNIGDTQEVIVPYINTDMETFQKTIDRYKEFSFDVCICGHNKPQGKDIAHVMERALESCWKKQIEECGLPES